MHFLITVHSKIRFFARRCAQGPITGVNPNLRFDELKQRQLAN
jgi:hypothetical protein